MPAALLLSGIITWSFALYGNAFSFYIIIEFLAGKITNERINAEKMKLKNDLLQLQIPPHFLFNCLVNLNSIIREDNSKNAIEYNTEIAKLLRVYLETATQETITLQKELEWIKIYMDIEKQNRVNGFNYEINVSDVQLDSCFLPPMLLQPFIENSIKYGLNAGKNSSVKLVINVKDIEKNSISISIADEKSFNTTVRKNIPEEKSFDYLKTQSTGINNIKNRIAILNQLNTFVIKLNITERANAFCAELIVRQVVFK